VLEALTNCAGKQSLAPFALHLLAHWERLLLWKPWMKS